MSSPRTAAATVELAHSTATFLSRAVVSLSSSAAAVAFAAPTIAVLAAVPATVAHHICCTKTKVGKLTSSSTTTTKHSERFKFSVLMNA